MTARVRIRPRKFALSICGRRERRRPIGSGEGRRAIWQSPPARNASPIGLGPRRRSRRWPTTRGAIRDDRRDPYRRHIVLHRKRRGAAECVAIGTLDVGMGQQHLADDVSPEADPAHGPHLIRGLAAFDDGLALDARPSIVIERADHRPHFIGRMVEHHAVIGSCHCSKPPPPSTRYLLVASWRELPRSVSCGSILAESRRRGGPAGDRGKRLIPADYLTTVR